MPADAFSSFLGMTLQATGNNNNVWGTILNGSALQIIERAIAGNISRPVTGGTLDLSGSPPPAAVSQVLNAIQIFTGALTANQIVILPNISRCWKFVNETTGAFQLLLQTPSGTFVNIPQGCSRGVTCDGAGNLLRDDRDQVGNFEYNAVANAGTVLANGASLLKTDFPDLFAKYGTTFGSVDSTHFTLPLLTDTGRFLRSTTSTLAVGTYQANLLGAHTHGGASFSGSTGTESANHAHSGSGATGTESASHAHGYLQFVNQSGASSSGVFGTGTNTSSTTDGENNSHAHAFSFNTGTESAAHAHAYSGTTGTIPSAGGAETRPEALAVVISIRY